MSNCKHCQTPLVLGANWWPSKAREGRCECATCASQRQEASRKKQYANQLERWLLRNARARANREGLPFQLTEDDIQIPTFCPVLGIPLFPSFGGFTDNSPSLDKFIPALGYVRGNVAVISHKANAMKSNATLAEVEALAAWMRSRA